MCAAGHAHRSCGRVRRACRFIPIVMLMQGAATLADSRGVLMVRRFLLECGATSVLAASAAEAHATIPTFKPHVIVSDIGMPVQDGFAFMQGVRATGLETPALALTAFARPEDRSRSIHAGFQMHLAKPVIPAELINTVATLAGRSGMATPPTF